MCVSGVKVLKMSSYYRAVSCIIICCVALHKVASQQEVLCSNPEITYTSNEYHFLESIEAQLSCSLDNPRWWESSDPCGPFNESTICPGSNGGGNVCTFNITDIMDRFYYCCTSGGRVEENLNGIECIHILICTLVIDSESYSPPVGFYGETLLIYVQLFAHPPPSQTPGVYVGGINITNTQVTVFQLSRGSPLLTFEYRVPIPMDIGTDVSFFGNFQFSSVNNCGGGSALTLDVPLRTRTDPLATPSPESSTTPTSKGLLDSSGCEAAITGLAVALAVVVILLIFILAITVVILCSCLRKKKASLSSERQSSSPHQPTARYNQLEPMYPSSSSTIALNQRNGLYNNVGQQQQSPLNGTPNHPNQLATSPPDLSVTPPPVTPTNLSIAQGFTHPHSGETPLMTFTPGEQGPTFPPVSQNSLNQYDEIMINTTVVNPIAVATVSGGGANGHDITDIGSPTTVYSEPTIENLARGVELPDINNSPNTANDV